MAPSEKDLLQESLREFSEGLDSSVPLRHFSEHKDEAKITEAVQLQSDKVFMHFNRKIKAHTPSITLSRKGDLMKEFWSGVEELADRYKTKNQNFKTESEAFLEKRVEVCCEDFRLSIEAELLMNPDMDLKTMGEFFDIGELKVADCFEHFWKRGNIAAFEEQKTLLKQKLDDLKEETLEKQSRRLKIKTDEEERKFLDKVKEIVLGTAKLFQCEIADLQRRGTTYTKQILNGKISGIRNYLIEKGKTMEEKCGKLYLELLGHLGHSKKSLDELVEVGVEDAVVWMERLNQHLLLFFVENDRRENSINLVQTENESQMPSNSNEFTGSHEGECFLVESEKRDKSDINIQQTGNENQIPSNCNEFTESLEGERFEVSLEVEPEETKCEIVAVRSIQSETHPNNDDDEVELDSDLASTTGGIECSSDVSSEVGTKRHYYQIDLDETSASVTSPVSKKLKQWDPDNLQGTEGTAMLTGHKNAFNVPGDDGDFPLLCAIRQGQNAECIEKMLTNGANVNIKGKDNRMHNAAHEVITSLINKRRSSTDALKILTLLVDNGFNLVNDGGYKGHTPLYYAVQYGDLTEDILRWFYSNGADFNYVGSTFGNSILFYAIYQHQSAEIIRKIIDFGGNPNYVNKRKWNALHMSARCGNESALEVFLDELDMDVNGVTKIGETPLHFLFVERDKEYEDCLELLRKKGADFEAKCSKGYVPLVRWMRYKGNPFPTLIKMKDLLLSISEEIASSTLTIIVKEIESKKEFLPSSSQGPSNEFVQFTLFLLQEKKAKLLWNEEDECRWKQHEWGKLDKAIFTRNFFRELKTTSGVNCTGELVGITSKNLGEFDLLTKFGSVSVQLETVLACLLACKNYKGSVEVCRFVNKFCAKPK